MSQRMCCETGCDKPSKRKNGMCDRHYRAALDELRPPCSVADCGDHSHIKGLCETHYGLWRRYGEAMAPPPKPVAVKPKCAIDDCPERAHCRGWCELHYGRWRAHGDPLKVIAPKRAMRLSPADIDVEAKACSTCKRRLPLDAFGRRAATPDGLTYRCKDCCRDAVNAKYANDPDFREQRKRYGRTRPEAQRERRRQRELRNLKMYGMTMEDFESLATAQGGVCAICRQPQRAGRKGRLAVDHDHQTRKVRGLLCDTCNVGLGQFKDNPGLLAAAIRYLRDAGTVTPISRPERTRKPKRENLPPAVGLW